MSHDWRGVDRLISEDKYQAAAELAGELRAAAQRAGDEEGWTRGLIRETQLRIGLHGYETAVEFLRREEWPQKPLYRAVLELFYAASLRTYAQAYSWEIRQRERVATGDELDLKAWTLDQIDAEIQRSFARVWEERETWGAASLGELAEYVEQNSYPARIRGTLRDAVTYLWAEVLADSSLWSPEQQNEIYRLDAAALIAGDASAATPAALSDPAVHPLVKLGAILADLEAWHLANDRPEAAFEARLERLRRLRSSFSADDERQTIRRDLEQHLDRLGRKYPWWTMGMATLAELWREEGDLVTTHRIAGECAGVHPESPGAERCRAIVATIEAPSYQLTAMANDGPQRRSIQVEHRNLPALYFRAYALDLTAFVERAQDYNLLPDERQVRAALAGQRPAAEWRVDLPPTPDYATHRSYVTPPMTSPGLYLIVASARQDFAESLNERAALSFIVTDLVLLTRREGNELEVTVRAGSSGDALSGVEVSLYHRNWQQGHRKIATRTTDADGVTRFQIGEDVNPFLLARRGDDRALAAEIGYYYDRSAQGQVTAGLIYTDRSVYRPRQTLHWKVVAYRGDQGEGRFQTAPRTDFTLDLHDANGEVVTSSKGTTNDFGTASGEIEIPAGRLLGSWRLELSLGGTSFVQVEEYKRPTFEVTLREPEAPLRLNREATLTGEVRYYFGLPVATGEVEWRVTRVPVYPSWWWWYGGPRASTATVAAGSSTLAADGTFRVTFTPEADERLASQEADVTYRYELSADVTDEGGETRSASRVFRLGFVAVEAKIASATDFLTAGEPATVTIRRTDLDGVARPGAGSWRLTALAPPAETLLPAEQPLPASPLADEDGYHTPGDHLRPRWDTDSYDPRQVLRQWDDGRELARGSVEHGTGGEAEVALPALAPGAYRLHYATRDEFGAEYETTAELIVAGEGLDAKSLPLPALLLAERSTVEVGETARFAVYSGLADQPLAFELFRDGHRIGEQRFSSRDGLQIVEVPIGPEHRGGFTVRLVCLRDHQLMDFTRAVAVPWSDRRLRVELASFRDRLTPGGRETWTVTVHGDDEAEFAAGAAEVLAYMYDRSLDVFAPHTPPQVLALYPQHTGLAPLWTNLGSAHEIWREGSRAGRLPYPTFHGDRLKFLSGYGIGGLGRLAFRGGVARQRMMAAPMAAEAVADVAEESSTVTLQTAAFDEVAAKTAPQEIPKPQQEPQAAEEVRSNFAETAFWEPHLLLGEDGTVSFEFTVPDSVTEWNVWLHAVTRDLRGGAQNEQVRSVKDLLVRPYLPRFFREGDRAVLEVVVNNASDGELRGTLDFEILDPESGASLLADFGLSAEQAADVPFTVAAGGGTTLSFPVTVPRRIGEVAVRAVARADDLSDGELRPLPVLPGRLHLAQSRFAALHDRDRRTLRFADLAAADDPSLASEQLVVTLDAQLFYSVLNALPYLVEYPYQCTEQTLNRFLSTGIVSSLFDRYPAVAEMASQLAARDTRLEAFDAPDPNRAMLLEETPWLQEARGGEEPLDKLVKVLDPDVARATREASLGELQKAQTSLGAFPWWPGGPPSPYMTLYILLGFSRALEFDVEVPQEMVVRAWAYLHRHYVDEIARDMVESECCWEFVTFLNYVLSSYPDAAWTGGVFTDDDRRAMLDHSWRHWRRHSPLLKAYLALTLERAGRHDDAVLVWDSVMDSAKTTQDEGTFWAPEDRAWLWYNDTIETHAFALRTLSELAPEDARRHGLVQWLFLNKKLNHWKSTRATAEVLYSLAHYLASEDQLAVREEATVIAGPRREHFVFEPDRYTGAKNQVVIDGEDVEPTMSEIVVEKETPGLLFASATWHFATDRLPSEASGDLFAVERRYFRRFNDGREWVLEPLADGAQLTPGDQLEVQLSIRAKHAAEYVHLRDPRGAGFEPESTTSQYRWSTGISWYEEIRDSGTNFFFEWLPAGEYTLKYRLRATLAGDFRVGPATLQSMYAPEFVAYSTGERLAIAEEGEKR